MSEDALAKHCIELVIVDQLCLGLDRCLDILLSRGDIGQDLQRAQVSGDLASVELEEAALVVDVEPETAHLHEHLVYRDAGEVLQPLQLALLVSPARCASLSPDLLGRHRRIALRLGHLGRVVQLALRLLVVLEVYLAVGLNCQLNPIFVLGGRGGRMVRSVDHEGRVLDN